MPRADTGSYIKFLIKLSNNISKILKNCTGWTNYKIIKKTGNTFNYQIN